MRRDERQHIVVNYHEDGSVTRTINGMAEEYATQEDFHADCEAAYNESLDALDKCNRPGPSWKYWLISLKWTYSQIKSAIVFFFEQVWWTIIVLSLYLLKKRR